MTCQEMSVDYINQCELKQVGFDSHTCRYKHTAFAESLGHVSLRWLTLQAHLKKQVTLLSLLVKKKKHIGNQHRLTLYFNVFHRFYMLKNR